MKTKINFDVTPEAVVLGECLSLLNIVGIYCWRNNTGAFKANNGRLIRYGMKGSSDIIGILPDGRFLAVECKKASGRVRPEQHTFINNINKNGGVGLIVHSCEELMKELKIKGVV